MGVGMNQVRGVLVGLASLWVGAMCARGLGAVGLALVPGDRVSVEWGVERAEVIVRGTVGPGGQAEISINGEAWREVTLDVAETIKGGRLGGRVVFRMRPGEGLAKEGGGWSDVLVFLNRVADDTRANVPSGRLGQWEAEAGWVFVLGDRRPGVERMDGTEVADGEALLAAVREAAAFAAKRGGTCAPYMLRDGLHLLVVPTDERLSPIARKWLADREWDRRVTGVKILSEIKTPENAALLKTLRSDSEYGVTEAPEWSPEPEWRAIRTYPMRLWVQRIAGWEAGDRPTEPEQRYGAVAWRGWAIGLGAVVVIALVWPRRWGRLGVGGRIALMIVGLMVLVGVNGWRTRGMAETYSVAGGGVDYEVVTGGWRVGLLRVQDDAPRHGWMVRRYVVGQGAWTWFGSLLWPVEDKRVAGVYVAEGKTRDTSAYPYRLVTLHYLWVVGVLGVWPAVWCLGVVRGVRRRERWIRECRCGGCGYDLRGHPVGAGCPECGRGR